MLAISAVVLGHLCVLFIVWQEKFSTPQRGEVRRMLAIRLIPLPQWPPQRTEPEPRKNAQRSASPAKPAREPAASTAPAETRSTLVPALPGVSGSADVGPAAGPQGAAPHGGAASGPATLSLRPSLEVLRGALANPATSDPRSNSPKPTFEERIAMGLDPDVCVKLERMPDGTVRRTLSRLVDAESLLQSSHGVGAKGARVCK